MTLQSKIHEYLIGVLGLPSTIDVDTPLIKNGHLDSFNIMELAMFLQDSFSLDLSAGDFAADCVDNNFGSVTRIVSYLQKHGVAGF
ncbi:MAG: hypothetical protein JWO36_1265 [Myxococcales bacterium]|nr:hypothetical protein [Myxococcales bacterium]